MTTASPTVANERLVSLDAYRGFVMLFMASSVGTAIQKLASRTIESTIWDDLLEYVDHARWVGCSPWDLIQPAFLFIVGAAMPFSYANRTARGQSWEDRFRHALGRSALLIVLGIFLSSNGEARTNFSFMNVLTQIGLGYCFVFLLLGRSIRVQFLAVAVILLADWALYAAYPVPPTVGNSGPLRFPADWEFQPGFLAHWEIHTNVGAAFDQWFLNLFPRENRFHYNPGGYVTLNFIPSIATMLIGVIAGEWLRRPCAGRQKIIGLFLAGAVCLIVGQILGRNVCPIVKRLWTPTWVLYSASWTLWLLALFYGVIELARWRRWAFPFVVVGMNSLAMYLMAQLTRSWTQSSLATHLNTLTNWLRDGFGPEIPTDVFRGSVGPLVAACAVLAAWWLVCFWLYRRRIFIRI